MDGQAAPGELELVRRFVNTLDVETGADELRSAAALGAWLRAEGLAGGTSRPTARELRQAVRLREALRSLLVANNGGAPDPEAVATLDAAARRARVSLRFRARGGASLEPAAAGVEGGLGRLLAIVAAAMADGSWGRLKACRAPDCRWAYYDHARNRSRAWCSMAVCGNRTKVRAYRRRRRAGAGGRGDPL